METAEATSRTDAPGRFAVGIVRALAWVGLGIALTAAPAYAHAHLTRSTPPADATLTALPTAIHLWFSERLELSLARITLRGPDGTAIPLGSVVGDAVSRLEVTAAVRGVPLPGRYAVEWHVMAADGHPSHGSFTFTISGATPPGGTSGSPQRTMAGKAPGGQELTASAQGQRPPATARGAAPTDGGPQESSGFDVGSPMYVIVRWAFYLGMVSLIGVVVFSWFVLGHLSKEPDAVVVATARVRAATAGATAAMLVLVAGLGRLVAQSAVMQAEMGDPVSPTLAPTHGTNLSMVLGTAWGRVWWLQLGGALVALGALVVARAGARHAMVPAPQGPAESILRAPWVVATLATLTVALTPALSGHAAAVPSRASLAIIADTLHVLGAGGWLGTLFAVLIVGIPSTISLRDGRRGSAVASLVNAFSPVALVSAGVLALTGLYAAIVHVGTISALWETQYGKVLLLKLAVLTPVLLTGFYNWRVVRQKLGADSGTMRVRRSAAAELLIGAVVILVTAVLVATSVPDRTQDSLSHACENGRSPGMASMRCPQFVSRSGP